MNKKYDIKFYTVDEVAEIMRVCSQTIRRRIKSKMIKAKKIGKRYLISENQLKKLLE